MAKAKFIIDYADIIIIENDGKVRCFNPTTNQDDVTELELSYEEAYSRGIHWPPAETDNSLMTLAAFLQQFSSLQKVDLSNAQIGHPHLEEYANFKPLFDALQNHPNLKILSICGSKLQDASYQALLELIKSAKLEELIISRTQVSDSQKQELEQTFLEKDRSLFSFCVTFAKDQGFFDKLMQSDKIPQPIKARCNVGLRYFF